MQTELGAWTDWTSQPRKICSQDQKPVENLNNAHGRVGTELWSAPASDSEPAPQGVCSGAQLSGGFNVRFRLHFGRSNAPWLLAGPSKSLGPTFNAKCRLLNRQLSTMSRLQHFLLINLWSSNQDHGQDVSGSRPSSPHPLTQPHENFRLHPGLLLNCFLALGRCWWLVGPPQLHRTQRSRQ